MLMSQRGKPELDHFVIARLNSRVNLMLPRHGYCFLGK